MTRIESIKYIIWGYDTPDLSDTEINSLLSVYGYNDCIKFIAEAQLNKLSQEPSQINDGANSFAFQDKVKGLERVIVLCNKKFYRDPENAEEPKHRKAYSLDTTPKNEFEDYWGRRFKCKD